MEIEQLVNYFIFEEQLKRVVHPSKLETINTR